MASFGTTQRPFLSATRVYGLLTKAQTASAVVFSTFTTFHGLQILSANVGGVRLSNHMIILGRPFYQDRNLEGIIIGGAITVHAVSGILKYAIRKFYWKNHEVKHEGGLLPYHHLTGYLMIPLVGLHFFLVRGLPIEYFGDSSFIDFGYVAWGLQNKPAFTYGLHAALSIAASYHIVNGTRYLLKRNLKKKSWVEKGVIASISIAFLSSLVIMGVQTKKIPLRLDFAKMYSRVV